MPQPWIPVHHWLLAAGAHLFGDAGKLQAFHPYFEGGDNIGAELFDTTGLWLTGCCLS